MLRLLNITNFATISHLELELGPGLTALTGETGAGKSIIVDALGILLGGKADAMVIRSGATQARVEGIVTLADSLRARMAAEIPELGLDPSDDEMVVAREINIEGKNVCRIGGRIVPLKSLEALGQHLVDIHGQSQHLSLYRVREHVDILDRYAGLGELRSQVAKSVGRLRSVRKQIADILQSERDRAQRIDLLQYQVQEIEAAALVPSEDDQLATEQTLVANAERLLTLASDVYEALHERDGAALDLLSAAARDIAQLEKLDPTLAAVRETAEGLQFQVEDLAQTIRSYRDTINHSPERLQQIEERLEHIDRLKRKYGVSVAEIMEYALRASEELDQLAHGEERALELKEKEESLLKEAGELAGALSTSRQDAALRMSEEIERELAELAMQRTRFGVDIQQRPAEDGLSTRSGAAPVAFDATGVDRIEFLMSPNPGEPLRPLARIASGGEAARLMLAIKSIVFAADEVPTLVFDEVDAGIGGRIGSVVGQKLEGIAKQHQVLCVTHLPQIACFADQHIRVVKGIEDDRTLTSLEPLEGTARITEISQMLGSETQASLRSAEEMLQQASEWKNSTEKRLL
ncbi:MAG: DNA repair protein RecN (Recombination protein N) [Chloroflexi bacterium]|jgi:DNA repair protein RecN (Recombination protein N)|nr:MAG: DNA repair protein RecN (Recombination protein N) [Chloroflexota bacterium]